MAKKSKRKVKRKVAKRSSKKVHSKHPRKAGKSKHGKKAKVRKFLAWLKSHRKKKK